MDYAILVATPDDMLTKKNVKTLSMRDDVLLELGLFMAKLGRTRTYLVAPNDKPMHILSDLLGITTVDYDSPDTSDAASEALADACERIKEAMRESEKELSLAMKRKLIKRLLVISNKNQGFVVTLQSESLKSLTDREQFEKIRIQAAERITEMIKR